MVLIVMLNGLLLTGIQQLQLMLLKIALIVGVEFHINVEFVKLLEPPEDQENEGSTVGWNTFRILFNLFRKVPG